MDQDVTWYEGRPQLRPHCVTWVTIPPKRSPNFRPAYIVAKRSPISATAEHLLIIIRMIYIFATYGWRRGVVVGVVRRMNEVTLRRARFVLGWVTAFGRVYHHGT